MKIINRVLTIFRDLLLMGGVIVVVGIGLSGSHLPYRSIYRDFGPFQLQAFPTGLALFHSERLKTPFYNFSPVNDYIIENGQRVELLSDEDYKKNNFLHKERKLGFNGIVETVKSYFLQDSPWYQITTANNKIEYTTNVKGESVIIKRVVTFKEPTEVSLQAITLWYNDGDLVVTNPKTGDIEVSNEAYPGKIVVSVKDNFGVKIDSLRHLIEVESNVDAKVTNLEMSMSVKVERTVEESL